MDMTSHADDSTEAQMTSLADQLREMYGRTAYTHKAHEKMADAYICRYRRIKSTEIVLSAITAGSLLFSLFGDSRVGAVIGAVLSTILLGLTLYFKEASLGEQAQKHTAVGSKLWGVRESLLSLLVDMHDGRPNEEVRRERDRLNELLEEIYKSAPRTDSKAYAAAQNAIKNNEELFFSDKELDRMLPMRLRSDSLSGVGDSH